MIRCYAFDVDETLEVSGGPVTIRSMAELKRTGHIVGLCGNWGLFVNQVQGWQHVISFMNVLVDKAAYLEQLKLYVPAHEFIMVGNMLGVSGASDDEGAARRAGWRFIREFDFAQGAR